MTPHLQQQTAVIVLPGITTFGECLEQSPAVQSKWVTICCNPKRRRSEMLRNGINMTGQQCARFEYLSHYFDPQPAITKFAADGCLDGGNFVSLLSWSECHGCGTCVYAQQRFVHAGMKHETPGLSLTLQRGAVEGSDSESK